MQIDGVEYKFKQDVKNSMNKRFVGYIAQQVEKVVPEAVQLIDGKLLSIATFGHLFCLRFILTKRAIYLFFFFFLRFRQSFIDRNFTRY